MITPHQSAIDSLLVLREQSSLNCSDANSEVLAELLRLLHAPDELTGLVMVARNLRRILRRALQTVAKEQDRETIRQYVIELRWVVHNAELLAHELFDKESERERFLRPGDRNPMIGHGAGEHGLWCLLWEIHPRKNHIWAFRVLQQHALFAHIAILRYWSAREEWQRKEYPTNAILRAMYRETLAIRHFVMPQYREQDEYQAILCFVPRDGSESEVITYLKGIYARHSNATGENSDPPPLLKDLVSIVWLLHRASAPEKIRIRRDLDGNRMPDDGVEGSSPVTDQPNPSQSAIDEYELGYSPENESEGIDDEDSDDDNAADDNDVSSNPGAAAFTRYKWTNEDVQACLEAGTHPDDALPSNSILLSHSKSGHRGAQSWAAMENQLLSISNSILPMEIAAEGMAILKRAADRGGAAELRLYLRAEVVLRMGATDAVVQSLVVQRHRPLENNNLTLFFSETAEVTSCRSEWLMPALPLQFRSEEPIRYDGCRECLPGFVLADYSNIGAFMRRLLDLQCGGQWTGEPVRPFDHDAVMYQRELNESLRSEAPQGSEALRSIFTFPRLSMVRFHDICDLTGGNVVAATHLTQRKHRTGEVPRFYETPAVQTLQLIDKQSVTNIQEELASAGFTWRTDLSLKASTSDGYVGSPYCPTIPDLSEFISRLRQDLSEVAFRPGGTATGATLLQFHNLYSVYSFVGYSISTCHRAVRGGYSDLDQVDPKSGLLSIKDKGERGRLVPVADSVYVQMRAYSDYIRKANYIQLLANTPLPPIFLLNAEWHVQEISPSSLRPYLPYPVNFGRHFVRTTLAEKIHHGEFRFSFEYINELMGHAAEGEDRAGPFSSFRYRAYESAMRSAMNELLKEIGFWPIDFEGRRLPVFDRNGEYI